MIKKQKDSKIIFYSSWVIVNTICMALFQVAARVAWVYFYLFWFIFLSIVVLMALWSISQWLILKAYIVDIRKWIPATFFGYLLGFLMLLYFSTSLQHLSFFLLLPCLALLGGVPLGILQWRVIKQVNHSHWWIIVTIADILLSLSLLQFWHIEIEVFTLNPFPVGFPYGLLTGLGMITFLRGGLEQAQKWGGKNSPKEASKG